MSRATDHFGNINKCEWALIESGAYTDSGLNEVMGQTQTQMQAFDLARVLRIQLRSDGEGRYQVVPLSLLRKEGLVA